VPWPLAIIGVYASDVVLLVAAVIGVMRAWRIGALPMANPRGWPVLTRRRFLLAFGLLLPLAVVNAIVSADPWLSVVGWVRIIALLLALAGLPYSERVTRAVLGGFVVAMGVQAVIGIVQFLTQAIPASTLLGIASHAAWVRGDAVVEAMDGRWLRAYGGFPHPNVFGTALLVALAALAAAGHGGPPLRVRGGEGELRTVRNPSQPPLTPRGGAPFPPRRQLILTFAFCILTFALVLTFSRAALLGLLILLAVCAWRVATRQLATVGALALVAAMAITWQFWTPRFTGSTPNEQRSITERTSGIEAAIAFANIPPFFGIGLHAMPRALWGFRPQSAEWKMRWPLHQSSVDARENLTRRSLAQPTHSVPLLALAEIGPIGVLVLVLVLVLLRHSSLFPLHSSLLVLPLLPSLLFDHHLWSLPIGLALVFVLAMSVGTLTSARVDTRE